MTGGHLALMTGRVVENRGIAPGHYLMTVELPSGFGTPAPGQFVMIKPVGVDHLLLSRPFSIHSFHLRKGCSVAAILYRIAGRGTRILSDLPAGSPLSVLGPLGKGFTLFPEKKDILLVGGGIGLAPLVFLAAAYLEVSRRDERGGGGAKRRIICYAGGRTASLLPGLEEMAAVCADIRVSTDDGSRGFHGTVAQLLQRDLALYAPEDSALYACGPPGMLKTLAGILPGRGLPCQVSTEERMACGLGACLGCAIALKGERGEAIYKRVCTEGPVFNLEDLQWE